MIDGIILVQICFILHYQPALRLQDGAKCLSKNVATIGRFVFIKMGVDAGCKILFFQQEKIGAFLCALLYFSNFVENDDVFGVFGEVNCVNI